MFDRGGETDYGNEIMKAPRRPTTAMAVAALLGLLVGTPATAGEAAEEVYSEYQRSIEVARKCRKLAFDQDQELAMGAVINAKTKGAIGAKRLSLLTKAQRDARSLIKKKGCDGAEPKRLLALFDQDREDILAQRCWTTLPAGSRRNFASFAPPGSPAGEPSLSTEAGSLLRPNGDGNGWTNFAVADCKIGRLDWLELDNAGHRRAVFAWDRRGDLTAKWVAP